MGVPTVDKILDIKKAAAVRAEAKRTGTDKFLAQMRFAQLKVDMAAKQVATYGREIQGDEGEGECARRYLSLLKALDAPSWDALNAQEDQAREEKRQRDVDSAAANDRIKKEAQAAAAKQEADEIRRRKEAELKAAQDEEEELQRRKAAAEAALREANKLPACSDSKTIAAIKLRLEAKYNYTKPIQTPTDDPEQPLGGTEQEPLRNCLVLGEGNPDHNQINNQSQNHIRVSKEPPEALSSSESISAQIRVRSESISNQNQVISGFPDETSTSADSPLSIRKNSNVQGSLREPVIDPGFLKKQANNTAWGELPLYDINLPFEIRNICLQVFFEPKNKGTGNPHWGVKVEINNTSEKCDSDSWESIWSGTLLPEGASTNLCGDIIESGYDKDDQIQAAYLEQCLNCIQPEYQKWKLVSILAKHSAKGGRKSNSRPLHLWVFVDMGKYDCSQAAVVLKHIWNGNAVVVLGNNSYPIGVKWKPGREKSRYISGRIIYQGFWFDNGGAFTVDMGDADLIDAGDYDFS